MFHKHAVHTICVPCLNNKTNKHDQTKQQIFNNFEMSESERGSSLTGNAYNQIIATTRKRKGTMASMANIKNTVFGCFNAFAFHFRFCFGNRFVFGLPFMPLSQPCYPCTFSHSFVRNFHLFCSKWCYCCCCCYCCYTHFVLFRLESCLLRNEQKHVYAHAHNQHGFRKHTCLCVGVCVYAIVTREISHSIVYLFTCISVAVKVIWERKVLWSANT